MAEIMDGGYAVEYICRITDETDGQENVPDSATMAQTNVNGKGSGKKSGKSGSKDASKAKTDVYVNSALQVAMPVLNGYTDGVAGQVVGAGKQVYGLGKAIAEGAVGGIVGAASTIIAQLVAKAVQSYTQSKRNNDAIAKNLDELNFQRQLAGLEKINYTRSGITGKVQLEEER